MRFHLHEPHSFAATVLKSGKMSINMVSGSVAFYLSPFDMVIVRFTDLRPMNYIWLFIIDVQTFYRP